MTSRTLRIVLIVSVVLNVFVIGGLAGAAIMWKQAAAERPLVGLGRPARLRQAAQALSPENRRLLRQSIRSAARSLRPQVEQARAARREAARLLLAPEFDRAALESALARARAADLAIRVRLEEAVIDTASRLPLSEREALVEGLDRSGALRQRRAREQDTAR
jgi:uncharacterized membrane protein